MMSESTTTDPSSEGSIQVLPQEVVDRIAAGEVVQRPSAVVKEVLENSLDAGSTEIVINAENGGLTKMVITDNGCGIGKIDLELAAQRFATSKLRTTEDFQSLCTFGFRGEALSSISMVARLCLTSRTAASPVAYTMSYRDGKPEKQPVACARKVGTTVTVQDIFYNIPHRRKSMRPTDEYSKILTAVQHYAIQYAGRGIGMVCQKSSSGKKAPKATIDLNTTNLSAVQALKAAKRKEGTEDSENTEKIENLCAQATKQVIAHVFGSQLGPYLHKLECKSETDEESSPDEQQCSYTCTGYLSSPSFQTSKRTQLVLFVNDRLVECNTLKRSLEEVYGNFTKAKPFLYLSLQVPPDQVDVNVHPTKREVAMLFVDDICKDISKHLRQALSEQSQNFAPASVSVPQSSVAPNPYKRKELAEETSEVPSQTLQPPKKPKPIAPSKLIRTTRATQSGALEPFLVSTQTQPATTSQASSQSQSQSQSTESSSTQSQGASQLTQSEPQSVSSTQHEVGCPLATPSDVDMSQPGAFAAAIARCTCTENPADDTLVLRLPRQAVLRPKKVLPTACNYSSVNNLRKRIQKQADSDLLKQLRGACFVGVVSRHRTLLQCGEDLVLLNHYDCAREMFYQLALTQFGGGSALAKLGEGGVGGVDIRAVIAQAVQLEDAIQKCGSEEEVSQLSGLLPIGETNTMLAEQASACLVDNAEMLEEYFSVVIEIDDEDKIMLTGLPVLLVGYTPQTHALPMFLLRLATEVDWSEEIPCFQGVCRELAAFYAELPSDADLGPHIQHQVFPAITTLLIPHKTLKEDGGFSTLTKLSKLYRVFERC
jgi:DNA mismatch repair protein MLH1